MERMKRGAMICLLSVAMYLMGAVPLAHADSDGLEVRYSGADEEQTIQGSELFAHVDNGLPGDVFIGSLNVINASDDACEVFLNAKDVISNGPDDMLDRIPFTVESQGEKAFEGALAEAESAEPISVGVIGAGEMAKVDCMAVIPSELTSEYADAAVGMNMTVGMRAYEEGNPLVSTSSSGQGNGAPLVQAGDWLIVAVLVLGVMAAAGAVIWCAWKKRMRMW